MKNRLANAAVAALVLLCAPWAAAQITIPPGIGTELSPGTPVVVTAAGAVQAQFITSAAGFTNQLFLDSPIASGMIFSSSTFPGSVTPLGSFLAGSELLFRDHVLDTPERDYFSGPAARNPDGIFHARVILFTNAELATIESSAGLPANSLIRSSTSAPVVLVGFEDIFGSGDADYNDMVFLLNNVTAVPEPSQALLLLAGLGLVGWLARRCRS
jgi:hypothetical protein